MPIIAGNGPAAGPAALPYIIWKCPVPISSYASLAKKLPRETNWNSILTSEYIIYSGAYPDSYPLPTTPRITTPRITTL